MGHLQGPSSPRKFFGCMKVQATSGELLCLPLYSYSNCECPVMVVVMLVRVVSREAVDFYVANKHG
jgi:hypothetical protein